MSIPGSANPLLLASAAEAGAYQIERSVRFNSADSAYLSRTPASAGNRKTWTWAGWVKRSLLGVDQSLFSAYTGSASDEAYTDFRFADDNTLRFGGWFTAWRNTSQVFRDTSAWYHIVLAVDISNATASERVKLYVNGSQVTAFATANNPATTSQLAINSTSSHNLGANVYYTNTTQKLSGYLADIHFIDGQALDPTSFTETDATTGQLIPKQYTGSFGTNGFWLKFSDNSNNTATTLGKDYSGNSNNWTPNNLSVTAGAGNDSLVDTPTSYGVDAGNGGEMRGNYCTLNPLIGGATLSNGNLDYTTTANTATSTIGVTSGKYYAEVTAGGSGAWIGITNNPNERLDSVDTNTIALIDGDGDSYDPSSTQTYTNYNGFSAGDVIGIALDATNLTVDFYVNNTKVKTYTTFTVDGPYFFAIDRGAVVTQTFSWNFGQRPFAYTAPSGYKALCTTNLPDPVVAQPSTVMDVKLYTGNGSTQTISGLNLSPDLVWFKARNQAYSHSLYDVIRGALIRLKSNSTDAEASDANSLTSFDSTGFTLGGSTSTNASSEPYVAWTWDAGSSTVSNTDGSITSSVRANASAGFSIVTYTSNSSAVQTVGHGLNVAPKMIIWKDRDAATNWFVFHNGGTPYMFEGLNTTAAGSTSYANMNSTLPTSTVFTLNSGGYTINPAGSHAMIAYCFAPVAGYSSAFSYTGNGSSDGPMVWLGFRPRWILLKRTDTSGDWVLHDTARDAYNVGDKTLYPNLSDAEFTVARLDELSNGFKLRSTSVTTNASGGTYIGFAFAESPFQYARAR